MFLTYTCAIFKITKNHKTLHQFCGSLYHSRTTTSVSVDKFLDQEGLTDLLQDEEDSDEDSDESSSEDAPVKAKDAKESKSSDDDSEDSDDSDVEMEAPPVNANKGLPHIRFIIL